jgi:hypothetical protein
MAQAAAMARRQFCFNVVVRRDSLLVAPSCQLSYWRDRIGMEAPRRGQLPMMTEIENEHDLELGRVASRPRNNAKTKGRV